MSYDLIFWRGRPIEPAVAVWQALQAKQPVKFVMPLAFEPVLVAFRQEFGKDLQVDEAGQILKGKGWELAFHADLPYLKVICGSVLAEDEAAIAKLRSAGRRAGCSMFNPQSSEYIEAPAFVTPRPRRQARPKPRSTDLPSPRFPKGAQVTHPLFGPGEVLESDGDTDNSKIRVKFASGDEKTLIARVLLMANEP